MDVSEDLTSDHAISDTRGEQSASPISISSNTLQVRQVHSYLSNGAK